jgi:hypothetical protein
MERRLQFTMPGTPVLRYGDEIGIGEDLRLPDPDAIRTPMPQRFDRIPAQSQRPSDADQPAGPTRRRQPVEVSSDREYPDLQMSNLELDGFGYRWMRTTTLASPSLTVRVAFGFKGDSDMTPPSTTAPAEPRRNPGQRCGARVTRSGLR